MISLSSENFIIFGSCSQEKTFYGAFLEYNDKSRYLYAGLWIFNIKRGLGPF